MEISALTADSRQVTPGSAFVAIRGDLFDGHEFLPVAAERGASIAFGESPDPSLGIPYVRVEDSRLALAELSAAWHGHPARDLVMIGVTGTDGKSTTCSFLYGILRAEGLRVGMITTVNVVIGKQVSDTGLHVTTPSALEVQGYLRQMVDAGLTHCILEATSHGLAQHRVSACEFDLAVVTNITHEHLDYHGSLDDYRKAKGRLFAGLDPHRRKRGAPPRTAVLNRDDSSFEFLSGITGAQIVSYGTDPGSTVRGESLESTIAGLDFEVSGRGYVQKLSTPMIGSYNMWNALAAYAAAVQVLGVAPESAARGISGTRGVPGRMELIEMGQPFSAIVDFAHTPNALKRALETARELTAGRVISVFGSAGLRDREKRRMMAEVSVDLADGTVLTAEDPRSEPLDAILAEMAQGAEARGGIEGETFWRVPDRGNAIRFALRRAAPGDIVIACGKGHEQSMCFQTTEYDWDDRIAMRAALAELLGIEGPEMPRLPTSAG